MPDDPATSDVDESATSPYCDLSCAQVTVQADGEAQTSAEPAAEPASGLVGETTAYTDDDAAEEQPVCVCTQLCTEGCVNDACPVCGADGSGACAATPLAERTISATAGDGCTVTLSGLLPKNAEVGVTVVPLATASEYVSEDVDVLFAYDIRILVGGLEWQPDENVKVRITPPASLEIPAAVAVTHVAEDKATGEVTPEAVAEVTTTEAGAVEFDAAGFSIYIGTTPDQTVVTPTPVMYWNGTSFYTDNICSAANIVTDDTGVPYTALSALLADIDAATIIYMKAVYTVSATESIGNSSYTVTLKRWDDTSAANADYTGSLISVPSGKSLTLSDITLDGNKTNVTALAALVTVSGTLNIGSGATLQNNNNNDSDICGGGVSVASGGRIEMTDGVITGNVAATFGGGVYGTSGTVTLSGGSIYGNSADKGGGVLITGGSTQTISGCSITGNSATQHGGGIYDDSDSTTTFNSGVIAGNTAQTGGGIYNGMSSTLNINGGKITGNTASSQAGGLFNGYLMTISGGSIVDNAAKNNKNILSNARIDNGTAIDHVTISGGTFTMDMGTGANVPTAGDGTTPVYLATITLVDAFSGTGPVAANTAVSEIMSSPDGYTVTDVSSDSAGKLYLWLPDSAIVTGVTAGGAAYSGSLTNMTSGASASFNLAASAAVQYVSGAGNDSNSGQTSSAPVATLEKAYENLPSGGAIYLMSGVTVADTLSLSGTSYNGTVDITDGSVRLHRFPGDANVTAAYLGILITVASGGSLTLADITIDGGSSAGVTLHTSELISVITGGTLNIRSGASLSGNYRGGSLYYGGAVNAVGEVNMSGGTISQNGAFQGGGVSVGANGVFTMTGGSISNNTTNALSQQPKRGGGVAVLGGTFRFFGGAIDSNSADWGGGGVFLDSGAFNMTGGEISYNQAMVTATEGLGGGVRMHGGTFTMSGGKISGNRCLHGGGGIYMSGGNLIMEGGEIGKNAVSYNDGGGVRVIGGSFTLSGGSIYNNSAPNGGGIGNAGTLTVSGGTISGNTATDAIGKGVFNNATCNLSGAPTIADEVYLPSGKFVNVPAAFGPTAPVPVNGADWAVDRVVATYGGGLTPNADCFVTDGFTTAASGQNVVLGSAIISGTARIVCTSPEVPCTLYARLFDATASAYQWQLSDDSGTTWSDIATETTSSFNATIDNIGKQIRVVITDTGSTEHTSPAVTILAPQISVTVPLAMTVTVNGAGGCTAADGTIINRSAVDVYVTDVAYVWNAEAGNYFHNYAAVTATLSLGAFAQHSFTGAAPPVWKPNAEIGKMVGTTPASIAATWAFTLGTGNYIKKATAGGVNTQVATVTYTIDYKLPS